MASMPAHERAALLWRVAGEVKQRTDSLAMSMVAQTGRPITECRTEVGRAVQALELSAEEAKRISGEVIPLDAVPGDPRRIGFTLRVPVGVVAAIYPFNAPLVLACHKLGPALAAGNSVVLKAPFEGALVSQGLVEAAIAAGVPPGALQLIHGGGGAGEALVGHPMVDLVSFTGGGTTARRILATAGLKRTVLELGGNSATIVHSDANLNRAADGIVPGAFGLAGQSCGSVQRLYVHVSVIEPLLELLVARTESLRMGDPRDEATEIGTLVSESAARRVSTLIKEAVNRGAKVESGGRRTGAALRPTILTGVRPDDRIVCEEVFGPTLAILPYDDIEGAFHAANDSPWGLQAGIFTRSLDIAILAARQIRVGGLNVNGPSRGRTELQPFGGVKQSGWGREGPRYAIQDMTELRMVTLSLAD